MSKIYTDQIERDIPPPPVTAPPELLPPFNSSNGEATPIDTSEDAAAIRGQQMATHLKNTGFHPVLIFGGALAGKTSFLTSMLNYFSVAHDSGATIDLDLSAIPDDDTVWHVNKREAQHLFFRISQRAADGAPPPQTATETPFFLPVTFTPPGRSVPVRFALLEGKGEWYLPVDESENVNPYRPFKGEIEGFLKGYTDSVTVIFVAPCVTDTYLSEGAVQPANSPKLVERDIGLEGAMKQFKKAREQVHAPDNHLFLLTKWDVISGISSPDLLHPSDELREAEARSRFKRAWHLFSTNAKSGTKLGGQRDLYNATHFSVGVVDRGVIYPLSQEDKRKVEQFQRKIWHWLAKVGHRVNLFDDMEPQTLGPVERLVKLLQGS